MSMCNTANVARAGRACLAGFALVILSASLAEAIYGPRTKIGANYQQTSTTMSLHGFTEESCNGNAGCVVLFQRPLGQKPLIVQHVSCRVNINAGSLRSGVLQTWKGSTSTFPRKRTYLVPVPTGGNVWVVNSPVMHLVESGERPVVLLTNSAVIGWFVECSISGTLQQP